MYSGIQNVAYVRKLASQGSSLYPVPPRSVLPQDRSQP